MEMITAQIENTKRQLISNQVMLKEHCSRVTQILKELDDGSLYDVFQQLETETPSDAMMLQISQYLKGKVDKAANEHKVQEDKIRELRSERDRIIKAKQALELESELLKKTVVSDIKKLQLSIQERERNIRVG